MNAVLAAFTTAKEEKASKSRQESLTAQLTDKQQELKLLEQLLQAFPGICEKISNGYLQIQQFENEKKELDTRFSTLGIFAGKEKRSITERIEKIRNSVSALEKDISNYENQKNGFRSADAVTAEISRKKGKISELKDSIAAQQSSGSSILSLSDALKTVYSDTAVYNAVRERNQTLTDEFVLKIRSTFEMGKYGGGIIKWRVLDIRDGKALLITEEGIDAKPYHNSYTNITWADCTLRTWLNSDFYNSAFSEEEKSKIVRSTVWADKSPQYATDPGINTEDHIFLLSVTEAEKYFYSDKDRACRLTVYAKHDSSKNCWWWLRSPGYSQDTAACVDIDGSVIDGGDDVDDGDVCVRPALWINLES